MKPEEASSVMIVGNVLYQLSALSSVFNLAVFLKVQALLKEVNNINGYTFRVVKTIHFQGFLKGGSDTIFNIMKY